MEDSRSFCECTVPYWRAKHHMASTGSPQRRPLSRQGGLWFVVRSPMPPMQSTKGHRLGARENRSGSDEPLERVQNDVCSWFDGKYVLQSDDTWHTFAGWTTWSDRTAFWPRQWQGERSLLHTRRWSQWTPQVNASLFWKAEANIPTRQPV